MRSHYAVMESATFGGQKTDGHSRAIVAPGSAGHHPPDPGAIMDWRPARASYAPLRLEPGSRPNTTPRLGGPETEIRGDAVRSQVPSARASRRWCPDLSSRVGDKPASIAVTSGRLPTGFPNVTPRRRLARSSPRVAATRRALSVAARTSMGWWPAADLGSAVESGVESGPPFESYS